MKRRHLIIGATTAASLVACTRTKTANNTTTGTDLPQLRWRMATSWPKSLNTIFGGAQTVCDRVKERTGGRFTIDPYAAGEIVPGLQVLDAVQQGTIQCGHTASYYYVGKNPALVFGTSVPFGMNAQQQNAWLYHGGGLETMHKIYNELSFDNFMAKSEVRK